jgi:hypothetical protein
VSERGVLGMTIRARIVALMRLEKYLSRRLAEGRAAGVRLDVIASERASLRWALEELGRAHPGPASAAQRDLEREADRATGRGARGS